MFLITSVLHYCRVIFVEQTKTGVGNLSLAAKGGEGGEWELTTEKYLCQKSKLDLNKRGALYT